MRPFVIRTHFYLPSGKGKTSMKAAVGHLRYMIDPERHQSEKEELLMPDHLEASIHAKYMIERPGSLGGFGPEGQTIPDPNAIAHLFEHHQGPIWRCFISVKEEDARAMGGGLLGRKEWEDAARRQLPKMSQALGLRPENVDWIAAIHRKDGHPHIHLLFWEKEPVRQRGKWAPSELKQIKQGWIRDLYQPMREQVNATKNIARQSVVSATREALDSPMIFLPKADREQFRHHLQTVRNVLPDHGSLRYAYLPKDAKAAVDTAADWLLTHVPPIKASADQYISSAQQLAQLYKDSAVKDAVNRGRQELRERMARSIIDGAKHLDRPLDHPAARTATSAVLWQTWKNAVDTPISRDDLLDTVDAVRKGHLTPTQAVQHLVPDRLSTKSQAKAESAIAKMATMRQAQVDHAELQSTRRTAQTVSAGLSRMARSAGRGAIRQQWEIEQAALEQERQTRAL